MIANKSKNQTKQEMKVMATLKEGLSTYTVADLKEIGRNLKIKNMSALKKANLIAHLAKTIPTLLEDIICLFDERRLDLIRKIIANQGVVSDKDTDIEIEEFEYFPSTGFMFTRFMKDEAIALIPVDLFPLLEKVIQQKDILAIIKRNTEWIKITHGLIYHYGVVPEDTLIELVQKYTSIGEDHLAYDQVICDAITYFQEISINSDYYSYWEMPDPEEILQEQERRDDIDYYPFSKKQLIEAGEYGYAERPKGYTQLVSLLEQSMSTEAAVEFVEECVVDAKTGYDPAWIAQDIQERLEFKSLGTLKKVRELIFILMDNTRAWPLKGFTPAEFLAQEMKELQPSDIKKGEVVSFQSGKKVGRNDRCPCGSGKKFKRCCGN